MEVKISDIKIKKRVRKDLGDLNALVLSLKKHGMLNPILVDENMNLIAGERRLSAAKQLGWESIPAEISNVEDPIALLEIEMEENTARKSFTRDELQDGYSRIEKLKNPGLLKRIWDAIVRFFKRLFGKKK